ncbi:phosphotransferase [Streptomyces sp. AHU1]|uniref:phosphotransferase n=1 Tax=Streptomyces sp. AHU1 TaxID=3377215 RepID=UPI003877FBAC
MSPRGTGPSWRSGRPSSPLAKEYDRLDFVLPFGLIHGDANIGNVLRHRDGHAVLIDLDGLALAPRERA